MLYKSFTGKTSFPLPVSLGGTFTSSGTVVTYNNIITSFLVGDYLYSTSLNEVRLITGFGGSNTINIESAFSSDITVADAIKITERITFSQVDVYNFGADGLFNGQLFPSKTIFNMEKKNDTLVFTVDAAGTNIAILALL